MMSATFSLWRYDCAALGEGSPPASCVLSFPQSHRFFTSTSRGEAVLGFCEFRKPEFPQTIADFRCEVRSHHHHLCVGRGRRVGTVVKIDCVEFCKEPKFCHDVRSASSTLALARARHTSNAGILDF